MSKHSYLLETGLMKRSRREYWGAEKCATRSEHSHSMKKILLPITIGGLNGKVFESKFCGKSASLILNPVILLWPSTNSYV